MQKFTRPLTREIELAGERLALTLNAQGLTVRPLGSRKPPQELSWEALLCHLAGCGTAKPATEEVSAAVSRLKKGEASSASASARPADSARRAPAGLDELLARLDRWLTHHRSRFVHGLNPPASTADLETLQRALAMSVPDDLRRLLSWHNGQGDDFTGHFEQDWDLMSCSRIAEAKRTLDGDHSRSGWQPAWIPFMDDDADDYLCLDTNSPANPVRAFWQGKTEHPVIAPSLTDWLKDFVSAAESGAYHEDPERGTFLRRKEPSK